MTDRPDVYYAETEQLYETVGRPQDHRYHGDETLWAAPQAGQEASGRDLGLEQRLFSTGQGTQVIQRPLFSAQLSYQTGNQL